MNRHISALLLVMATAGLAMAGNNDKKVIMTVGGEKTTLGHFVKQYQQNKTQSTDSLSPEEFADLLAGYRMRVAAAREARVDTTAAFREDYTKFRDEFMEPYLRDTAEERRLIDEAYSHFTKERAVSHIMVEKGDNHEQQAAQRRLLDSLRTAIAGGADFSETARRYSIDRSVVQNGGNLGYIPVLRLPYSFEQAAYQTPVGEMSEIVETPFGYHLLRVESEREPKGEVLVQHILKLTQGKTPEEAAGAKREIDSLYRLAKSGADFSDLARRESEDPGSASSGGSLPWFGEGRMVPEFEAVSYALDDGDISEPFATSYGYHIVHKLSHRNVPPLDIVREYIVESMKRDDRHDRPRRVLVDRIKNRLGLPDDMSADSVNSRVMDYLISVNPDAGNQLKEYYEGLMVYELGSREVWNKAATDTVGLARWFSDNRARYSWTSPKYKGYVVYALDDSTGSAVRNYLETEHPSIEEFGHAIETRFDRKIRVERVLVARGEHPAVDAAQWGDDVSADKGPWHFVTLYDGKLLEAPESVNDVRGAAVADYQASLERNWMESLKRKYPVKVDKKLLKSIK